MASRSFAKSARVRRAAASACALAISMTSCTSSGGVESDTPRVTVGTDGTAMSLLLTQADVQEIDGLSQVVAQDFNEVPVFENPDPRGPCGGVAPSPPISAAVGRAFTRSSTSIFQLIAVAGTEADAYLAALQADRVEPCGPFTSMTNTGATQTISQVEFVDLGALDADGIAWTARADVGQSGGFAGIAVFVVSGHLVMIQTQSGSPFDQATLQALVQRAAAKFNG